VSLTESEREGVGRAYTEDLRAYDYYLLGRHYLNKWQLGAIEQAIQYLRRAVEADPSYARGYAGLAYAYSALGVFGGAHPADTWPHARAAAEKALALDEGLAEAHTALALEAMSHRYDWRAAKERFEQALELDPSSVDALVWYGLLEGGIRGEHDHAMELLARAERLDPRSPGVRFNSAWVVLWAEGYAEAEAAFDRLVTSEPEYFGGHEGLASALVGQGRYEEALTAARTTLAVGDPDFDLAIGYLGYLYGRLDRTADAVRQLERLDELAETGRYVSPVARAYIHAGLDEVDEALAWLEKGYEERTHWLIWLQTDPYFQGNLASDPRFQELLRRIGFPE
jgi:serine/threonine-protein kinase